MDLRDFQALVESAPDGIVVSRQGIVLYANAAAVRLVGAGSVADMVGRPMTFLSPEAADTMRRRIQQMAETGERLVPREYPARRADGTEITVEIASTLMEIDGAPAVLAYARDVTERVRLRARLAHADRLASLGTMAAGIAHEINNPLALVRLSIEALDRRTRGTEPELTRQIVDGIDRIATIVRDLRFFGRGDEEPRGPVDLGAIVDAAARLVEHELRPRATLHKALGDLPMVVGVTRGLEQVFVNLLLNAVHSLGERTDGRITIEARVEPTRVLASVTDDGRGIPPELLGSIFEPFVTTRASVGGTGLGLWICRDILARIDGAITARSTVGQGTTMEIVLVRAKEVALAAPLPAPTPVRAMAAGDAPRWRILVVDDEPVVATGVALGLEELATCVVETSAARALERLRREAPFDAIVCDVMMPGMTGLDLHETIAAERPELAPRFVFITGGTYTSRATDYLARVPNPRVAKPFASKQLVEALARLPPRP